MKHSFLIVCAATPKIKVADCEYNGDKVIEILEVCEQKKVKLVVFPELCLTGYSAGDLFLQDTLLRTSMEQLVRVAKATKDKDALVVIGLPFLKDLKLYNVAAVLKDGEILGIVPKSFIPNYSEFYEARYFAKGNEKPEMVEIEKKKIPFGTNLLFHCESMSNFTLGVEICEDLWVPTPPSSRHALAGATIIANVSASDETTGKDIYRRELVKGQSARLVCGYIYADAGEGESTTDFVYAGHNLIAENGSLLKESKRFQNEVIITEIDLGRIASERRRISTFFTEKNSDYIDVKFDYQESKDGLTETELTRIYDQKPFVPNNQQDRDHRCEEILTLQAMGLKKRLEHTNCNCAVIGISGGLDSTLALLVTIKAFDMLGISRSNLIAVTMPCFGTTDRTYQNAVTLTKELGATLNEIPISEAVILHLRDIGHEVDNHDVTYENAQARERTQILMNIANQQNGLVIGTGDMSELALGWATYNGDHMSMYGVNCSVPKTLVRYLVQYYASSVKEETLKKVLLDVLDTPVSPELLPPKDGVISQRTEDIVGPYELHDFFLYYIMRFGFEPSKVYRLAQNAFEGNYSNQDIYKWLTTFYRRFFSQQFKRSCLPDGPKVGSVALSPRGDLRMPSDACVRMWMNDLEKLQK